MDSGVLNFCYFYVESDLFNLQNLMSIVTLNLYDVSQGLAVGMCRPLFGLDFNCLYLTTIGVYGRQYYFTKGICRCLINQSPYGSPQADSPILGQTQVSLEQLEGYLEQIKQAYSEESYNLITFNSNMFSNLIAKRLLGKGIQQKYCTQFKQLVETPLGKLIPPFFLDLLRSTILNPPPGMFQQI